MSTFKLYSSFVGRAARALFIQSIKGARGAPYGEYL